MSVSKRKIGIALSLIICAVFALTSVSSAGMATTSAPARQMAPASAPSVNPDRTVTFTLKAPQANEVILNFQNKIGPSPAANQHPMTKGADGVWSITMGPLDPDWYGYGFVLDGVKIPDPANRDIWSGATSAWSYVFVPGPAADFMADAAVPHGAVATLRYFSKVTQTQRQMQVYTPPGYGKDNRGYPVFYLYHGGGGNDTDWIVNMRANFILDNLIAQNKIVPMILVMPDGNAAPYPFSGPITEDRVPEDLLGSVVPAVEENYRVAPGAKNRAVAGLSMGGLWTLSTLMLDPGEFAYLGVFGSGWFPAVRDDLEQNHLDLLTNPAINKGTKLLWITVGDQTDIAYNNNYATLDLLDKYNINYTFVQGTGGHVWGVWRHNLWDFAQMLFRN